MATNSSPKSSSPEEERKLAPMDEGVDETDSMSAHGHQSNTEDPMEMSPHPDVNVDSENSPLSDEAKAGNRPLEEHAEGKAAAAAEAAEASDTGSISPSQRGPKTPPGPPLEGEGEEAKEAEEADVEEEEAEFLTPGAVAAGRVSAAELSEEEPSTQSQGTTGYSADQSEGDESLRGPGRRRTWSLEERARSRYSTGGYASEQGTDFSSFDLDDEDTALAQRTAAALTPSPFAVTVTSLDKAGGGGGGGGGGTCAGTTSNKSQRRRRFERKRFREARAASKDGGAHGRRHSRPGDAEEDEERADEGGDSCSDTTEDCSEEEGGGSRPGGGGVERVAEGAGGDCGLRGEEEGGSDDVATPRADEVETKPDLSGHQPRGNRLDFQRGAPPEESQPQAVKPAKKDNSDDTEDIPPEAEEASSGGYRGNHRSTTESEDAQGGSEGASGEGEGGRERSGTVKKKGPEKPRRQQRGGTAASGAELGDDDTEDTDGRQPRKTTASSPKGSPAKTARK